MANLKQTALTWLGHIARAGLVSLWVVPLLLSMAVASVYIFRVFEADFDITLNASMNWSITFGYGVLMIIPMAAAAIRGKGKLASALLVCLVAYSYSVGISVDNPYYWGHTSNLYVIVWAVCLALSRFELMTINLIISCVAYVMVEKYGAIIGPGVATDWKLAQNILYALSAAAGAVAAMLPTVPPNDAETQKNNNGERVQVPKAPTQEGKKAA